MSMVRFFVQASGLKSRPSWSTSVKTGMNATAITRSEKKTDGPTSMSASRRTWWKSPFRPSVVPDLELLVGVLDLDDGPVHEDADRDRDAGEGHDVRGDAEEPHRDEGEERRRSGW